MHRLGNSTSATLCEHGKLDDGEDAPRVLSYDRIGQRCCCALPPFRVGRELMSEGEADRLAVRGRPNQSECWLRRSAWHSLDELRDILGALGKDAGELLEKVSSSAGRWV